MNEQQQPRARSLSATLMSAVVSIVFITVITVWADLQLPLKDWLKNTFSHHWVGKGILTAAIFLLGVLLFSLVRGRPSEKGVRTGLWAVFWASLLGTVVIVLFFLYEAFLKA